MNMLISCLVLCVAVVIVTSSPNSGWKTSTEYRYEVSGRTLSGLSEVTDQYSGIAIKAQLQIRPKSDELLTAKIVHAKYAQIHSQLSHGWDSDIPDAQMNYKPLLLNENEPFQIAIKNGVVHNLIVSRNLPNWEANMIKAIVSQIQLDVRGENIVKSHLNQLPEEGPNPESAVFKTMEDTVTGKCETLYEIAPLPPHILQSQPWLAPLPHLKGDGEIIEIVKNKNSSRSRELVGYHFGLGDMGRFEPGSNSMGEFLLRTSVGRAIISGNLKRHTIQSSSTTNKIVVKPTLNDEQNGIVVSHLNLTLSSVESCSSTFPDPSQPQALGSLIYRYNSPFSGNNQVRPGKQDSSEEDFSSPYGSSSSSSSSSSSNSNSNEGNNSQQKPNRKRRNASDGSSSSSSSSSNSDESSSSSSSSSSSEEYWQQERPRLNDPPESPLLPLYVGYKGQSVKYSKEMNVGQAAQKLCQQIAQELQRPNQIPKQQTLTKFVFLASLTRVMTEKEMQEVAHELYGNKKEGTWEIYRDAVAECGTGPALLTIQDWIKNGKISGEEAAEVIATMSEAARQPTEEYMRAFYSLITEPQVQQQPLFNDSAVLSYSRLVRKVYVDPYKSHNQFPVHVFGSFRTKAGKQFVTEEYVPYLTKQLNQSIDHADSHRTLVYIRALAEVGHQSILTAFEPYLEGKKQASQFQRLSMVLGLDKLVKTNPRVARSVLYKIYQNSGEEEEIRTAAVYQLMRTSPPGSMLQRMAEYTNVDEDEYVNAAVKSSIQSAAKLEGDEFAELRKNARSAEPLLTDTSYGAQYSINRLHSYVAEEMNMYYKQTLQTIGSEDHDMPKGLKYALRLSLGGARRQKVILSALVSSIDHLTKVLERQVQNSKQEQQMKQSEESQWSGESVANKLNIKNNEKEQLEASFIVSIGHSERMFTLDNHTIDALPQVVQELQELLKSGQSFQYTKLTNRREICVAFPTEMGLPFIYTLDNPSLISVTGQIRASTEPPLSSGNHFQKPNEVRSDSQIHVVLSSKVQSEFGFITPFDHHQYTSGYDKNAQFNVPIKAKVRADLQQNEISVALAPIEPKENARILHFSTWPFTSKNDLLEMKPGDHRVISREPQKSIQSTFGKETGMPFRIEFSSEQRFMDPAWLYEQVQRHDVISALSALIYDENIQNKQVDVYYQGEESSAREMQIRMSYQHWYQPKPKGDEDPDISQFHKLPRDPRQRQVQLSKMASSGIQSAKINSCDLSVKFEGSQNVEYNLTMAYARSPVDKKARALLFASKQCNTQKCKAYEIAASAEGDAPNANELDFIYALKFNPASTAKIQVAFGQNYQSSAKIRAKAVLEKTERRKKHLQDQPRVQQCRQEMREGNKQLPACANLTASANLLDSISVQIQHENFSPEERNCSQKIYRAVRHLGFPNFEENSINPEGTGNPNRIDLKADFDNDLRALNVSMKSHGLSAQWDNIRIDDWLQTLAVPHPVFSGLTRVSAKLRALDTYMPNCVIDQTAVNTLDNKTYPIDLRHIWTVMMHYHPSNAQQEKQKSHEYVALVRDSKSGNDKKEIKISVRNPATQGKLIEIDLKPADDAVSYSGSNPSGKVFINQEQQQINDQRSTDIENGAIKCYSLPNGEIKIEVEGDWYLIYDGSRAKLTPTSSKLRDSIRGLCGNYNGETADDFTTPENCVIEDPHQFAASYTVEENEKVRALKAKAQKSSCHSDDTIYANVISPYDAGRSSEIKQNPQQHHKQQAPSSPKGCTKHQSRYVQGENDDQICFTIRPLPTCRDPCKPQGHIMKNVPVHCVPKNNISELWKKQIDKGASPDFSLKSSTRKMKIQVPQKCTR